MPVRSVEETALKIEHSFSVDEVRVSGMSAVSSSRRAVANALSRLMAGMIHRGQQWHKPEKSAKTLPDTLRRRFFPDTQITAYRLAA